MSEEILELDHVLIAVADLANAAREIEARHGLASVEGGRHPGWGTANRIVPLGETYLELIAVIAGAEAARSPFWELGRSCASRPHSTARLGCSHSQTRRRRAPARSGG
jgi:Glyoxalase-like domain